MRPIKFRAWDNEEKKYFKPTYEAYKGNLEDLLISLNGHLHIRNAGGMEHQSLFPDRFILEQFTGLHDKNNKEIYEGDIIGFGIDKPSGNRTCIVESIEDFYFNEAHCLNEGISDVFVIGNIHGKCIDGNPEGDWHIISCESRR